MSTFNEEICVETEDFKESEDLASVTIVRSNTVKLDSGIGKIVYLLWRKYYCKKCS